MNSSLYFRYFSSGLLIRRHPPPFGQDIECLAVDNPSVLRPQDCRNPSFQEQQDFWSQAAAHFDLFRDVAATNLLSSTPYEIITSLWSPHPRNEKCMLQ